ncbi:MAG: ERCC4 domain-containing protein [Phycisphaerae bacterium]|nr:ERCC4 domain-containing protein [Phycisphaerae bacterium]
MRFKRRPKPVDPKKIVILRDDREHKPWSFLSQQWPVKIKRLAVGDYTVEGYESKIAIEKKSGFKELFANLTSGDRPRFERYLGRLGKFPVKCIVVEDAFVDEQIAYTSKILQRKGSQLTPQTVYYWSAKIICEYGIPLFFCSPSSVSRFVPALIIQAVRKADTL